MMAEDDAVGFVYRICLRLTPEVVELMRFGSY